MFHRCFTNGTKLVLVTTTAATQAKTMTAAVKPTAALLYQQHCSEQQMRSCRLSGASSMCFALHIAFYLLNHNTASPTDVQHYRSGKGQCQTGHQQDNAGLSRYHLSQV